ncbi:Cgr1 family-domain-containing protein [Desarmillaria tabescens]|uniref:Cgr1 family-domain-containing protein n=1 Tax=Armillaria tabescens TaxID=1929756 RepID=A0AA39NG06_ARMTA|nr:Cgr1 family-domain-containing protein [Desarmillaria tabescens]KAK0464957.1 Cgr1 family-domain-containing protein [Desarmillaria tabescens]
MKESRNSKSSSVRCAVFPATGANNFSLAQKFARLLFSSSLFAIMDTSSTPGVSPIPLRGSSNGRVSAKSWKPLKSATARSLASTGRKSKSWDDRMEKAKKAMSIKKLEKELKEEKQAEITRRKEITSERRKAAEEKRRLEEEKAKMGARKAARLRRKAGRSKKING